MSPLLAKVDSLNVINDEHEDVFRLVCGLGIFLFLCGRLFDRLRLD